MHESSFGFLSSSWAGDRRAAMVTGATAFLGAISVGAAARAQESIPPGEWTSKRADVGRLKMHYVEQGAGPLVVLCHGFPESWYSWRHQIPAVAKAGFRVVAPDLRGYGRTGGPQEVEAYTIKELVADITGLLDALGEKQCVLVGHDFGAVLAWNAALLAPDRVRAIAALSVPYNQRGSVAPVEGIRRAVGGSFNYIVYFQKPGVAEAELEADFPHALRSFYYSSSAEGAAEMARRPTRSGSAKLLDVLVDPNRLPAWLSPKEFDFYVAEFEKSRLARPLNWYRNLDTNWALMESYSGAVVKQPTLFMTGKLDPLIRSTAANFDRMSATVPGLVKTVLIPDCGHWIQQEKPSEVSAELIAFLNQVHK